MSKGLSSTLSLVLYINEKNLDKPEIGENSFIGDERVCNYYQRQEKEQSFGRLVQKQKAPSQVTR